MQTHEQLNRQTGDAVTYFLNGGKIQYQRHDGTWEDVTGAPFWVFTNTHYRPTPDPVVKPWDCDTCPVGKEIRFKWSCARTFIVMCNEHGLWLGGSASGISFKQALSEMKMPDGSPCGITS